MSSVNCYRDERKQRKRLKTCKHPQQTHNIANEGTSDACERLSIAPEVENPAEGTVSSFELSQWEEELQPPAFELKLNPCSNGESNNTATVFRSIGLEFSNKTTESGETDDCSWVLRKVLEANSYRFIIRLAKFI
jgi:hypothetical protein